LKSLPCPKAIYFGCGEKWPFLIIKKLVITFLHANLFVGAIVQAGDKPAAKKGGPKL
jgi:hypothetical protein